MIQKSPFYGFRRYSIFLSLTLGVLVFFSNFGFADNLEGLPKKNLGKKIIGVTIDSKSVPSEVARKFEGLVGTDFNPSKIKDILELYHEMGGESNFEVHSSPENQGLRLNISMRERNKIKSISFEGNVMDSSNVLMTQIDLKEGEEYDTDQMNQATLKLTGYYYRQGYLSSEVKGFYNSKNSTLTFTIVEGAPTLVASIKISPLDNIEDKALRERFESELYETFSLHAGDRIQKDKVTDGLLRIKDWLRDHDFLSASDPTLSYKVDENSKVNLEILVKFGPRIKFGFRGNEQFSYRELMSLIAELKEVSSGSSYIDSVKRTVQEAYKDIGHSLVKISTVSRLDQQRGFQYVSLIINEGPKVRIRNLTIEGLSSLQPKESEEMFYSFSSHLVQKKFFHEAGIVKAGERMAEYLKSKGFLSAKLEFSNFEYTDDGKKVDIHLLFSEGTQTFLKAVIVEGLKIIKLEEFKEVLGLREGEPFNIDAFEKGLVTIKDRYQSYGNLNAQIINEGDKDFVVYDKEARFATPNIKIEEGPTFRVGEIIVKGNKKTHARVVLRALPFIQDDILVREHLNEAEENIRKLSLFSSVIVRPIDSPNMEGRKDILILVEESTPGSVEIAPGFRNDLGARLGLGATYANIGGWNRSATAETVWNRRFENYRFPEYKITFGFREPYLAEWPVVWSSNLVLLRRQFNHFDATVNRITSSLKRDLSTWFSVFLEYSYDRLNISVSDKTFTKLKSDEGLRYVGSFTPGFVIDSRSAGGRENKFNPTRGILSVNRYEVASPYFGSKGDIGFTKITTNNSAYFKLSEDLVLALAGNFGYQRANSSKAAIPVFYLFNLGGIGSVRGYGEDSISVETSDKNIYRLGLVNYRAEIRMPFSTNVGTAVFIDAGNLMLDRFSMSPSELRSSLGAGLRYNTPVGPVALDFAWRLQTNSQVGDTFLSGADRFKVHFSIGAF